MFFFVGVPGPQQVARLDEAGWQTLAVQPLAVLCADAAPAPVIIQIKVKPNARVSALDAADDGTFVARIKSPPVDGKANAELIELVARRFQCSKGAVSIKSGTSSRTKWVRIETQ